MQTGDKKNLFLHDGLFGRPSLCQGICATDCTFRGKVVRRDDPHAYSKVHISGIIFKLVASYLAMLVEKHWRVHAMMFVSSICNLSCQCGYSEMILIELQHRLLIARIRLHTRFDFFMT
jgi:hypothetical protein